MVEAKPEHPKNVYGLKIFQNIDRMLVNTSNRAARGLKTLLLLL